MALAGESRLRLTQIKNDIWAFNALDRRIDDLAHAIDVLVVNGVALCLADLLEDDLLRQLCCNPAQNSLGNFGNLYLSPDLRGAIGLARVLHCDLTRRLLD